MMPTLSHSAHNSGLTSQNKLQMNTPFHHSLSHWTRTLQTSMTYIIHRYLYVYKRHGDVEMRTPSVKPPRKIITQVIRNKTNCRCILALGHTQRNGLVLSDCTQEISLSCKQHLINTNIHMLLLIGNRNIYDLFRMLMLDAFLAYLSLTDSYS